VRDALAMSGLGAVEAGGLVNREGYVDLRKGYVGKATAHTGCS
jgi:hypothetical protein